ncbi:hypothetical protein BD309DRAFT_507107 [Dichomitus squalens]|uniref:Uncharacterized protein n=1 Tax=Dichomitus squalens TaxID=114155 RepID=A0A4Q9NGN2_9APHY|nr:hypothetical protein BD309DRAFT_507107 [Dichomitus squalens]TBU60153.1 hypothetical protein BD310DRAFT_349356 [Dichomitus squalens]
MSTSTTPSPPTGPATQSPGFSSIFQSPGGPPLILVCIAAGLLLGAFIGVLLMRRMRPRVVVQRMNGADFLRGLNPNFGEKPTLLDIHLLPASEEGTSYGDGKGKVGGERGAWGHVSPFAARYLSSSDGQPKSSTAPPSSPPSFTRGEGVLSRIITQFYWANPRWRPRPHEHSPTSPNPHPDARRVQLAVTISMPSPQRPACHPRRPSPSGTPRPSTSSDPLKNGSTASSDAHAHASDDANPVPDCCIGTVVVSYRPDPNGSPAAAPPAASPAAAAAAT